MTAAQLIALLRKLPPEDEVAMLAASGCARPPEIVRVNPYAGWINGVNLMRGGLKDSRRAWLLRPQREVI